MRSKVGITIYPAALFVITGLEVPSLISCSLNRNMEGKVKGGESRTGPRRISTGCTSGSTKESLRHAKVRGAAYYPQPAKGSTGLILYLQVGVIK